MSRSTIYFNARAKTLYGLPISMSYLIQIYYFLQLLTITVRGFTFPTHTHTRQGQLTNQSGLSFLERQAINRRKLWGCLYDTTFNSKQKKLCMCFVRSFTQQQHFGGLKTQKSGFKEQVFKRLPLSSLCKLQKLFAGKKVMLRMYYLFALCLFTTWHRQLLVWHAYTTFFSRFHRPMWMGIVWQHCRLYAKKLFFYRSRVNIT